MLLRSLPLFAIASLASAHLFDAPVINLTGKTFDKEVLSEDKVSMVAFYAPWCGHCKNLAPEFALAAKSLAPLIPFYAVDCDEQSNKALCAKYEVKGFPTIKTFSRGGKIPPKDYNLERKRGALSNTAAGLTVDRVKKLSTPKQGGISAEQGLEEIKKYLKQDTSKPHALLIHPSSSSVPMLWKTLSQRHADVLFGFLRDADGAVGDKLKLPSVAPGKSRVITWKANGEMDSFDFYEGALTFEPLHEHFSSSSPFPKNSFSKPSSPSAEASSAASSPTSRSPPPPNASVLKASADREKAQKKWAEEERRDFERRAKLEARRKAAAAEREAEEAGSAQGGGTKTEEGEAAEPAEASPPSAAGVVGSSEEAAATAADPEPASPPSPSSPAQDAQATTDSASIGSSSSGPDSLLTPEQEEVLVGSDDGSVIVEQDGTGGMDEEVVPELKRDHGLETELPVGGDGDRKRDEL